MKKSDVVICNIVFVTKHKRDVGLDFDTLKLICITNKIDFDHLKVDSKCFYKC